MKKSNGFNFLLGILLTGSPVVADEVSRLAAGSHTTDQPVRRASSLQLPASAMEAASATTTNLPSVSSNALPPLPAGVTELKFSEVFRQPIGPRGLEYTDRLRSLEGRRIRILGFMVRQDETVEHCFLLSPVPQTLHVAEYGLCDDLPATTLHVFTSAEVPAQTPFTPGLLLLTGRLRLGNRTEADGRISTVRLELDAPTAGQQEAAQAVAAQTKDRTGHVGPAH